MPCASCATNIVETSKSGSVRETKHFITEMIDMEKRGFPLYADDDKLDGSVLKITEGFPKGPARWSPELQKELSDFQPDSQDLRNDAVASRRARDRYHDACRKYSQAPRKVPGQILRKLWSRAGLKAAAKRDAELGCCVIL